MADSQGSELARLSQEMKSVNEWVMAEHRDFREQMERAERLRGEAHGRFMLLAAAIVGVVIPLVGSQPNVVASSATLIQAAKLFLAAIAISAMAEIPFRLLGKRMRDAFSANVDVAFRQRADYMLTLVQPGRREDAQLKTLADSTHKQFADATRDREIFRTGEDLVFYGLFVVGLLKVAIAFL